jgi:Zn ribbon nucleic-acid-binding protein
MIPAKCVHAFARRPGWWWHRVSWMRWECTKCGYTTRTYDAVDRMGTRPIHPHMSVAVPGYNTE